MAVLNNVMKLALRSAVFIAPRKKKNMTHQEGLTKSGSVPYL
jgi:hypothetical protein